MSRSPGSSGDGGPDLAALGERVSAARAAVEARGETFYQGASRVHLSAFPPRERWDDWVELSSRAWPAREEVHYMLVPTTCFNCESACGLLAYVDRETRQVRKFEGNPEHPGSRGRNCAKGPATINQVTDPDRVLYPMRRAGRRGQGPRERREGHRGGHPAVEHRYPRRLLAVPAAGQRGGDEPGHRQLPDPHRPVRR